MDLHIIYNYKALFPDLKGRDLTDALIRLCLDKEDLIICRTEQGKPYLQLSAEETDEVHISVSHSRETFALLTADVNAGLDIQYPRDIDFSRLARRYFTEEEADYTEADPSGHRFFECWTRKEAYCKYTGEGLAQIMRKDTVLGREDVVFRDIRLEDGCFCSVCTEKEKGDQSDEIQISYRE